MAGKVRVELGAERLESCGAADCQLIYLHQLEEWRQGEDWDFYKFVQTQSAAVGGGERAPGGWFQARTMENV